MYDWDQDQNELAQEAGAPRYVGSVPSAQGEFGHFTRWLLPLMGGVAISLGALAMVPGPTANEGGLTLAAVLAPVPSHDSYELAEIPLTLAVYDRERAIEFLTSLQRFSDDDLQSFAQTSAESVALPGAVLSAYWADALALATSEIRRRGLAFPAEVQPPESLAAEQG